jgi:hypothetical protein
LLVVGSDAAPDALLERVADARKAGASILALDRGDDELDSMAHEYLAVRPVVDPVSFDGAQHLVSIAVGEPDLERLPSADAGQSAGRGTQGTRLGDTRGRLARLLNAISGMADS